MTLLYTVYINENEISSDNYIDFRYRGKKNTYKTIELEIIPSAISTYSISKGQTVIIKYGETLGTEHYLFRGTIEDTQEVGSSIMLICYDKLYQLTKKHANESYDSNDSFAGKISSIIIDLITRFGSLNASTSTIQDTGTLVLQEKLFCFDAVVFDKVIELCEAVQYVIEYNPEDDYVYAYSFNYYSDSNSFSTALNISGKPTWNDNITTVINYLRLYGASKTVNKVELFSGTGAQTTFELAYVPDKKANVKVEVYDGVSEWVEQVFGREGTVGSSDYNYTMDDDPSIKSIVFQSGSEPASATDNIRVSYSYNDVLFSERWNDESKTNYPLEEDGYREKVLYNNSIQTITDLENIIDAIITYFADPYTEVKFTVFNLTSIPHVGYTTTIQDDINGRTATLRIDEISFSYPSGQVFSITMAEETGDYNDLLYSNEQRLLRLEEESRGNITFVRVSTSNQPTIELPLIQIASEFTIGSDFWDTAENWDSAGTWGLLTSEDDFSEDLTSSKWDEVSGTWNVTSGIYKQTDETGTQISLWNLTGNKAFSNPNIEFKIRKDTNHTSGILFNYDDTDGYVIRFKDASNIEYGTYNTTTGFTADGEFSLAIPLNVWHFWKVNVYGTYLLFLYSRDGIEWIKGFNTSISVTGSKVGFVCFDSKADFDNFKIGNTIKLEDSF